MEVIKEVVHELRLNNDIFKKEWNKWIQ
jgi:hypothetical protein